MTLHTGFGLFAFLPFTLLACSGGGTSVSSTSSSATSTSPLTSVCAGNYTCTGGGQVANTQFIEQGGECYLGAMKMMPDGTATDDEGRSYTWNGDTSTFNVCEDGACLSCVPGTTPTCTGVPRECLAVSNETTCNQEAGCLWHPNAYDGVDYGFCGGSPNSCDEFGTESACVAQRGCAWN